MIAKFTRISLTSLLLSSFLVLIPIHSASALSQGTATNGDTIGGSSGTTFSDVDCTAGSIVTRISTSSTTHDGTNNGYITGFSFICTPLTESLVLTTPTVTQTILGTPSVHSSCPAGAAAVGIKTLSTTALADVGIICATLPGRSNINTSINTARAQTPNGQYICPDNAYLIGFGGNKAAGIDRLIPRCATFPVVTQSLSTTSVLAGTPFTITYSHFCPVTNTSRTFYDQITGPGTGINTVAGSGTSSDGNYTYTLTKSYTLNSSGTWRSSPYINRSGCTGMVSTTQATITVLDTTPPSFTSSTSFTTSENISTSSNAATITISESSTVTISSGSDLGLFNLIKSDSVTAQIRFKSSPNFENPSDLNTDNVFEITLTASDSSSNSSSQSITITVTDVLDTSSFNSFALAGSATTATYRGAIQINASVTVASRVTFKAANVGIPGCKSILATGSGSTFTVSCSWKPSKRGGVTLSASSVPTNLSISGASANPINVSVVNRSGPR